MCRYIGRGRATFSVLVATADSARACVSTIPRIASTADMSCLQYRSGNMRLLGYTAVQLLIRP